jgi:hypothetical protein
MKVHSIIEKMIIKFICIKMRLKLIKLNLLYHYFYIMEVVLRERAFVEVKGLNILVKY